MEGQPPDELARPLARWRNRWFLSGGAIDLGIALVGLWLFSQLDPSLPLFGIVFFSDGVQAQLAGIVGGDTLRILGPISVAMNLVSLGLLLTLIMRSRRAALAAVALLVWIAALRWIDRRKQAVDQAASAPTGTEPA